MKWKTFELFDENLLEYNVAGTLPVIDDVGSALIERSQNPINAEPLNENIKVGMKVVLICDDYTR